MTKLIQYKLGNIFDSEAQVIVNTVNCEGIMGKGLALAFKERYPEMFKVYQKECNEKRLRIGRPTLYKTSTPWILNFPTKEKWRANSKLEFVEKGLRYFIDNYKQAGIQSIAFPKLGAQNGKLSWDDVGPLMASYLSQIDIPVYIYIAEGDVEHQNRSEEESDIKRLIWEQFSNLALSPETLCQELHLNPRDAKRVRDQRVTIEFKSLTDIEGIPNLAKTSLKKIKDYITHQQYKEVELTGMPQLSASQQKEKKHAGRTTSTKRKKRKPETDQAKENALFATVFTK